MQDVKEALIEYFGTVSAITDLVSTRIFGGRLPDSEVVSMPRKCIVIRSAGGFVETRTHREQQPRIDIFCYGEDYYEAGTVDRAVADALIAIRRTVAASTLLHSAGYSGPYELREPDTGWEYMLRTASIRVGETAVV